MIIIDDVEIISVSDKTELSPWLRAGLNVDSLRYFLASIELGSFQAAAECLHVTPQAVGKAIARLEAELGPLIIRDRRLRGLTPTGRALTQEAGRIVAELSDLAQRVAPPSRSRPSGPVAVGATSSVTQYVLPPVCARVLRAYPKIRPHLLALDPPDIEAGVLSGQLDFGVMALPPSRPGLEALPGPETPSVIVAAEGPEGEWSDYQYVVPRLPVGTRDSLDGWPVRGYRRKVVAETNQLDVALRLAETGVGATVVPVVAVLERLRSGSLKVVAQPPVPIVHRLWVSWRAGAERSAAARALADELAAWQIPDQGFSGG